MEIVAVVLLQDQFGKLLRAGITHSAHIFLPHSCRGSFHVTRSNDSSGLGRVQPGFDQTVTDEVYRTGLRLLHMAVIN
jgi:hypothetical protein